MNKIFVTIAGNIGAGKTSLTHLLSGRFGWTPHLEAVGDNPYLTDFYKDMARWSFPLQIYFLTHRYKAHQEIVGGAQSAIQDRSIYEDAGIFARNLLDQGLLERRDYENYLGYFDCLCQSLQPPDLMVYLKKSLPNLKQGIKKRARDYEKEMPDQYLSSLNQYYDEWIDEYQLGKKVIIECDDLDFVNQSKDFESISGKILDALDQRDFLFDLGNCDQSKLVWL